MNKVPDQLADAIPEAKLLLAHSSRMGIPQEEANITTIVRIERCLAKDGAVSVEDEQDFWLALASVAAKVAPVSIDSLVASEGLGRRHETGWRPLVWSFVGPSTAARTVRIMFVWTAMVLFGLLSLQAYWFGGASLYSEYLNVAAKITALQSKGSPTKEEVSALETLLQARKSNVELGIEWLPNWVFVKSDAGQGDSIDEESRRRASYTNGWNFVLTALQSYILPLLYGALGACVFVLRSLTSDIRDRTYKYSSNILYWLRLILGAVAGLAVGWIAGDPMTASGGVVDKTKTANDVAGQIKTLSPVALAFVAGYSVELLFSLMDRVVAAFAGRQSPDAGKTV